MAFRDIQGNKVIEANLGKSCIFGWTLLGGSFRHGMRDCSRNNMGFVFATLASWKVLYVDYHCAYIYTYVFARVYVHETMLVCNLIGDP